MQQLSPAYQSENLHYTTQYLRYIAPQSLNVRTSAAIHTAINRGRFERGGYRRSMAFVRHLLLAPPNMDFGRAPILTKAKAAKQH
ncbi:hypothetical protein HBI16_061310 [Parastagonospora nodorum]|nr:hypothetical protein HBI16_061310 [Parastagonospora nodorum]